MDSISQVELGCLVWFGLENNCYVLTCSKQRNECLGHGLFIASFHNININGSWSSSILPVNKQIF